MALINRSTFLVKNNRWHRSLAWLGGITLLVFGLSGLTHPLLSFTGPKPAQMMPPHAKMQASQILRMPEILKQNQIDKAIIVKLTPSVDGTVMQVTETNDGPRRYFDLKSGHEIPDHDKAHAVWLARHYSALYATDVRHVSFQSEFSEEYPWVNRLLPVYRVEFATPDKRAFYVYTEANAFAGVTNDWRRSVQYWFRALHTWSWLDDFDNSRVIIISMLMLALTGMAVTGTLMVFMYKSRKIREKKRRWHRSLAYAIWLPIFGLSISGLYHILQMSYVDNKRGLQLGKSITLGGDQLASSLENISGLGAKKLSAVSIVEGPGNKLYYRLNPSAPALKKPLTRKMRFRGMPTSLAGEYFDAENGTKSNMTDETMALHFVDRELGLDAAKKVHMEKVTRFGSLYDFRNKRLPVWRIDYQTSEGDKIFVDPATGILVDRLVNLDRYELYSFQFLHKWNFLRPLMSNEWRNGLTVFIIGLASLLAILGYAMLFKRRRGKKMIETATGAPARMASSQSN